MSARGRGPKNDVDIVHFRPYMYPAGSTEALAHTEYVGTESTWSVVWTSDSSIELYMHDERTPGGLLMASGAVITDILARIAAIEAEMPDDYRASATLVGSDFVVTMSDGTTQTTSLAALLDNVNVVPGTYTFDDANQSVTLPLTNGSNIVLDHTAMASDAELAAAIAALPPEEYLAPVVVSPAGVATFITNQGTAAGSIDVAGIANSLEDYLLQPTLSGTTVTFPLNQGGSYTLDYAMFNESVTDNGDGTFTFDDGGGTLTTWSTDTDDQVVASADGSVTVTSSVLADGQIDYDLSVQAYLAATFQDNAGVPFV